LTDKEESEKQKQTLDLLIDYFLGEKKVLIINASAM
jgi:hypothetical protein